MPYSIILDNLYTYKVAAETILLQHGHSPLQLATPTKHWNSSLNSQSWHALVLFSHSFTHM